MTPAEWSAILIALITAGLLKYAVDFVKWLHARRAAGTPEAKKSQQIATVDQSLAVVARARDELEADNARLRVERSEDTARYARERIELQDRHERERAEWIAERTQLRAEIADLERRLRELLTEVQGIRLRTSGPSSNPGTLHAQKPSP